jgi:hypothetical protein
VHGVSGLVPLVAVAHVAESFARALVIGGQPQDGAVDGAFGDAQFAGAAPLGQVAVALNVAFFDCSPLLGVLLLKLLKVLASQRNGSQQQN